MEGNYTTCNIYQNYYNNPRLEKWRQLSAMDKSENLFFLWSLLNNKKSPTIIDIGCGDGSLIYELDKHGFGRSYVGFEISQSGIQHAQQRQYIGSAHFKLFDGTSLPVEDQSFDLAILCHVLEHLESPRQLIREAARVAKYVFVEVPLELNFRTPRDFRWTDVGHINLYNSLLIRQFLQSAGLNILAERITCPRREVFTFTRHGLPGILHHIIKASLLKICSHLACRLWTYQSCLIATRNMETNNKEKMDVQS